MAYVESNGGVLSGCLIVSMGLETAHWSALYHEFPDAINCCINVCDAFARERDDVVDSTGFEKETRDRMRAKRAWPFAWKLSTCILREFGVLIILCRHGRHRSLSLAIELADHFEREFRCIRDSRRPTTYRPVEDVMRELRPRLSSHVGRYGGREFPVIGVDDVHPNVACPWPGSNHLLQEALFWCRRTSQRAR